MGSNVRNAKKRPLSATATSGETDSQETPPLYLEEGLFAVHKPLGWTSQDVVGKLRYLLESDARTRKAPDRRTKKRRPWMKVGHGGTLDPLATGVLVCGVGSGTKNLQKYLVGSKAYRAEVTLGYQTTTLDDDPTGEIVERKAFDHVTSLKEIETLLETQFTGKIQQIPPIFSALKRDGKKLYELGRKGQTAEDLKIEPREVTIYDLKLVDSGEETDGKPIEKFCIEVECGGGTYIRSLVRDIGIALGTVATMTKLERSKQGQFLLEHSLPYSSSIQADNDAVKRDEDGKILIEKREDCNWTIDSINEAIRTCRETVLSCEDDGLRDK
eukprot:CAMPEP_0116134612 /NCGR_PEP_ID=MMETSP0329-20121206/10745_1 /TAXON_ID=697910 /ORGANISM="Pseudo-nitzschia arenysensis, Strain B593" /LENGTH=327 /DNA_ID=CAMNT_0003629347 /DNA_START=115 /DNA_END=1098 /DNA_ORIENTATION=-